MSGKKILLLPDLQLYVEIPAYLTKVNYNVPACCCGRLYLNIILEINQLDAQNLVL